MSDTHLPDPLAPATDAVRGDAASSMELPRRDFLRSAALGAAGVVLSSHAAHAATASTAYSYSRIIGSNDRVRVGVVGYSDRFREAHLPIFKNIAKAENFEIVALSDIWSKRRDEGTAEMEKTLGGKVRAFRNNEEMYSAKATDAVVISTADFQHAFHGVEAMQANQDAYIEKPLANTMRDARAIRDAVKKSGRIVQIGTQRRSASNYIQAAEYLKSGKFGDIVMAEMTWNVNQPGRWRRPSVVPTLKEADTDWRRYLGNRPYEPFNARKYLEFRLFWPYSSGIPDQWLVHQIDTVHWFTDLPRPRSVVANGGIYQWKDGRTNWDTCTLVFDYGPFNDKSKGFQVVYTSRMTNSAGDVKELYYSNGGMLNLGTNEVTPSGGLTARLAGDMGMKANQLPAMKLADVVRSTETSANTGADRETTANVLNWMKSVRDRKKPNADIEAGYNHSVALCMAIAAIQTGKRVTFNDVKQDVIIA